MVSPTTLEVSESVVTRGVSRGTYRRGAIRVCSGCRGPRDRGRYQAYCRQCHNDYERATRLKHSELPDETKRRANCRSYTNMMIKRGKLERRPCACGSIEDLQARQLGDYTDPFNVDFVCKACRTGKRVAAAA